MTKKESLLGVEDVPWLWREIPKIVAEFDIKVYSIRCCDDGVAVKFIWNCMTEFDVGFVVFNVLIRRAEDLLANLHAYVDFQWKIRKDTVDRNRAIAVLRLSDYDGHYLNQ